MLVSKACAHCDEASSSRKHTHLITVPAAEKVSVYGTAAPPLLDAACASSTTRQVQTDALTR